MTEEQSKSGMVPDDYTKNTLCMSDLSSPVLQRLTQHYDDIVACIYRAGSGVENWRTPINMLAEVFESWAMQFLCVNKQTRAIQWAYESGTAEPAAGVDFLRKYHLIDPRLKDVAILPVNDWYSCEEHYDEAFVQQDRYYSEFLIPYGGRFLLGAKILEDSASMCLFCTITKVGRPPLSQDEKQAFKRITEHFVKALNIQQTLTDKSDHLSVGAELLERMRQPMLLIDSQRHIGYRNQAGRALLMRNDMVYDEGGLLVCRDCESDRNLTIAIRELALVPFITHGADYIPADRQSIRLKRRDGRRVATTLLALRPETTMGSFGRTPQALFTVFEPGTAVDIDPFLLSATFDLTPAEARLAAKIVNGQTPEQSAQTLGVKISTIRSQLSTIYGKTGATGQADLVRLVLSATAF
ncbi:putative transcriptional regulator, LuxR family [Candidatus Nitrotoga sp. HW29]|uniref:helix-turn-helix transcriptional regulator n=1 Tax=Candidatus Nitrotoga sp. HW29 TaxID=2886963 RepID=UPI001EF297AD|nr:helix-turn-helix transcriptional regulator [Candidatus Nitrotoga sp. HW29]CAH1904466.1 putative transcriptional regulator, LuxR family [Candidatus Nitrotoga sp. HW29]